jgi:hypothetical protein
MAKAGSHYWLVEYAVDDWMLDANNRTAAASGPDFSRRQGVCGKTGSQPGYFAWLQKIHWAVYFAVKTA